MYDVIIVGAGPAGLSAALILGRCRRRVLICDAGKPRNIVTPALHGFLTRDGIEPNELRNIGRDQLEPYETVKLLNIDVTDVWFEKNYFEIVLNNGRQYRSRKLLLATGVVDCLPEIEGFNEIYGRSAFHCPYCDGWEQRDKPLAIYGKYQHGKMMALELTVWSSDLVLCTDGPADFHPEDLAILEQNNIKLYQAPIARFESKNGQLTQIIFFNGEIIERQGLFFNTGWRQHSIFPEKLGCELTQKGAVKAGELADTRVPGLYVAGDAKRSVQLAIIAAAEGAEAAFAINTELLEEDLKIKLLQS